MTGKGRADGEHPRGTTTGDATIGDATTGLDVRSVSIKRGGLTVCRDVSVRVVAGEITVVLGANGAGKTTLLDGIAGVAQVESGRIIADGRDITRLAPFRRARAGLAYAEEGRSVFSRLSVAQNIRVVDTSPAALEAVFDVFPRLAAKRDTRADRLSGGEQQMLIIARALATRPRYLLVDELSLGLAPKVVSTLMDTVQRLAAGGLGVLLVEQFAQAALRIGTTAHILQRGSIVRSAPCAQLLSDRDALASPYLAGGQ